MCQCLAKSLNATLRLLLDLCRWWRRWCRSGSRPADPEVPARIGEQQRRPQHRQHAEHAVLQQQHGVAQVGGTLSTGAASEGSASNASFQEREIFSGLQQEGKSRLWKTLLFRINSIIACFPSSTCCVFYMTPNNSADSGTLEKEVVL